MPRATYLTTHHGTFWFQIRVPDMHQARYGQRVRTNLQTNDFAIAKVLALRLASEWLLRFAGAADSAFLPQAMLPTTISAEPAGASLAAPSEAHPAAASVAVPPAQPASPTSGERLSSHVTDLHALFRYWRGLNSDRAPSTLREFENLTRTFQKFCSKSPAELVRTDISSFRDHCIQRGDARATVTKKLSFLSAMLQTAFDAGYLPSNVARGLKVPRPKVEQARRIPFPTDALERIFSTRVYTEHARPLAGGGDAIAWIPMMALASGARLEELCQLRVRDLHAHELGLLMSIDDGEGQRIKTTGSRRTVPLHPALIDAGFERYLRAQRGAGQEWLFPELVPDHDGRRGGNFGKFFARYLRQPQWCGISDSRLVFHSLRHTFKTLCRGHGIAEEVHDALTGHVGATVGRSYGVVPVPALVSAMNRITLPVALPRVM